MKPVLCCVAAVQGYDRRTRRALARGTVRPVYNKPGALITPKQFWPPYSSHLIMDLVEPEMDLDQPLDMEYVHAGFYAVCLSSSAANACHVEPAEGLDCCF